MRVKAISKGFYEGRLRSAGEEFEWPEKREVPKNLEVTHSGKRTPTSDNKKEPDTSDNKKEPEKKE
jgi:hypothetical protein